MQIQFTARRVLLAVSCARAASARSQSTSVHFARMLHNAQRARTSKANVLAYARACIRP